MQLPFGPGWSGRQDGAPSLPVLSRIDPVPSDVRPAPDCQFRRSELKTMDSDGLEHLKVEYERQCYRNAELIVRERLRRLQAAVQCTT